MDEVTIPELANPLVMRKLPYSSTPRREKYPNPSRIPKFSD
jgi:hypothetical protein